MSLSTGEIDSLIDHLMSLKAEKLGHFHIKANCFEGDPGVADIEFSKTEEAGDSYTIE